MLIGALTVFAGIGIGAGIFLGMSAQYSTLRPVDEPDELEGYDNACEFFNARQSERCILESIASDAINYANRLTVLLCTIAIASAGLIAAVVAAIFAGIDRLAVALGPVSAGIIIAVTLIIASILAIAIVTLTTASITAHKVASDKQAETVSAAERESLAREKMWLQSIEVSF